MAKDTMSKTSKVAKGPIRDWEKDVARLKAKSIPASFPRPRPGRLPVATDNAKEPAATSPAAPLWTNFGTVLEGLPDIAREARRLSIKKAAIQEEIDALNIAAKGLMEAQDDTKSWSVRDIDETWVVVYVKPQKGKSKILPELLIKQGVGMDKILKATKTDKPGKPYVSIRDRNEKYEKKEE